jgi:predicted outer membrane repeat protein
VTTKASIVIDNDVTLDGGGNLVVDGNRDHRVFSVEEDVRAELRGFQITGGDDQATGGGGILNEGTLILADSTLFMNNAGALNNLGIAEVTNCSVTNNNDRGIKNQFRATMELTNSTVSGNVAESGRVRGEGGGIWSDGFLIVTGSTITGNTAEQKGGGIYTSGDSTLVNITVSGNTAGLSGGGIHGDDSQDGLTLINSTVSGNSAPQGSALWSEGIIFPTLSNSIVDGDCAGLTGFISNGYNIESPGDSCDLNPTTDRVNVSAGDLSLGPLADNGGPTETRALLSGSVAIDAIPEAACVDSDGEPLTTDQRGDARPEAGGSMCDVGAFEF